MTQSRLTLNCLPSYVADFGKLLDFLRKLDPVSVVAGIDNMNAISRIYELQTALPNAKIIGRFIFNNDGAMHLKPQALGDTRKYVVSPLDAINAWGELGKNGRVLYLLNEPQLNGASDEIVTRLSVWIIEAINLASQRGISLCIGNFGVGHPALAGNGEYDPRLDDVLMELSKTRDQHTLGIHVYQPADVTTRLEGMVKRCKTLGIKLCRVNITEAGFDASSGSGELNGYKSRGYSGSQFANYQIDKMENIYNPYIMGNVLQSVATFVWGGEASWHNFNVEQDTDWQTAVLDAKNKGYLSVNTSQPTPPPPVTVITPPPYKGIGKSLTLGGSSSWNLRAEGEIHGQEIGMVKIGEVITLYPSTIQANGGHNWYYIERANAPANESISGWIAYVLPATGSLPPVVTPPPTPEPTKVGYVPNAAQIATLESWRKSITESIAAETAKLAIIDGILATIKETA